MSADAKPWRRSWNRPLAEWRRAYANQWDDDGGSEVISRDLWEASRL